MNLTDSSTTSPESSTTPPESSTTPSDSSKPRRNHQQNLAGITTNPSDSSILPTDSSTNKSDSTTNPSDSSIINDIDENHLIEDPVEDLVTAGDLPEDEDEDASVKEPHGKIPWNLIFCFV